MTIPSVNFKVVSDPLTAASVIYFSYYVYIWTTGSKDGGLVQHALLVPSTYMNHDGYYIPPPRGAGWMIAPSF
jgi:hypothetical protein